MDIGVSLLFLSCFAETYIVDELPGHQLAFAHAGW